MTDTHNAACHQGEDCRYFALLQGLYESILITDSQGKILDANVRAEELFLIGAEELRQRMIQDLISGFDDSILRNVDESLATQKHLMIEASGVRRDGTLFPAEIAVNRLPLNSAIQLCFSIRDVTTRNETVSKLEEAQEEILKMEKIQTRLETITTLAHEINNPLQSLLSMVESDRNVRYATPLNRIVAVLQEMRREEELKRIKYTGESYRFEIPPADVERSRPRHVLIVDDEPTLVKFFEYVLQHDLPNLSVDCAANGAEAMASFHIKHHSLIILDVFMPVMNGEETFHELKRICKEKKWEMPAVIFCTGYTPPDSIRQVIAKENVHCYLPKPVTKDTLLNAVKNRLEFYELTHPQSADQ
jgi:PAS domain S-box-containing protein